MGKSAQAPDYTAAAERTAQSNAAAVNQQTWANRPTQITPFGTVTWDSQSNFDQDAYNKAMADWQAQGAALGKKASKNAEYQSLMPKQNDFTTQQWTQNYNLTPEMQAALDSQQQLTQNRSDLGNALFPNVSQALGAPLDYSQFDAAGNPLGGFSDYNSQAGDALLNQFNERMQPQFARDTEALEQQLRNRGLKPGDAAYDQALSNMRQSQGDQTSQATWEAILRSGQEAQRMQGMDQTASAYNTGLRQQQIAEALQQRNLPLNEINALLSGQQVGMAQMPSFTNAGNAGGVDYTGAAQDQYSAALDKANATNTLLGQGIGALGSIFNFGGGK